MSISRKRFHSLTGRSLGNLLRRRESQNSLSPVPSEASTSSAPRKAVHWDDAEPLERTVSSTMSRREHLGPDFDGDLCREGDGPWMLRPVRKAPNPFIRRSRRLLGQTPGPRAPIPSAKDTFLLAQEALREAELEEIALGIHQFHVAPVLPSPTGGCRTEPRAAIRPRGSATFTAVPRPSASWEGAPMQVPQYTVY